MLIGAGAAMFAGLSKGARGQTSNTTSSEILFRNVRVFDGVSPRLSATTDVLVRGNQIAGVGQGASSTARVIDGAGRTLMPGLIDAHCHLEFFNLPVLDFANDDPDFLQVRQVPGVRQFLMDGFTSARDAGGPTFGLKKAIDQGFVEGPRIWPSGALISQTSGHGESRPLNDLPSPLARPLTPHEKARYVMVADGVPQVLERVREQLFQGASQVKISVGGGVSSNFDPIDVTEYSEEEIRAAVGCAQDWGTYVMVHGYTPRAINRALDCGVVSIEHGHLLDEPTLRRIKEMGVWLSTQPFLQDEDAIPTAPGSENRAKYEQVAAGTSRIYEIAHRLGLKVAFGTDIQLNPNGAVRQAYYLPKLVAWYPPAQVLKMATADNADLLALSGLRSPYKGVLGRVQAGALADLLLINGDPIADINLLSNPNDNLAIIMKDGVIYKEQGRPI
jgi:imidazolonepropionase-like amidohydrolase